MYCKVLLIQLCIFRIRSAIYQVVFKAVKHRIETYLVISSFLVIVVEMEIYTAFVSNDFT